MKQFLFFIFFLLVSTFYGGDVSAMNSLKPTEKLEKPSVGILLNLGKLSDENQVNADLITQYIESMLQDLPMELQCEVVVTAEITVGIATIKVEVKVSGPCKEVRQEGRNIANSVINEIVNQLRNSKL